MAGGSDMKGLRCIGSGRGGCISISPTTILESGKVDEWMDHFWVDDVGKSRTQGFLDGDGGESVCRNTRTENGPRPGQRRFTLGEKATTVSTMAIAVV